MIKIEFNQTLFDKHIEKISESITTIIAKLDRSSFQQDTNACLDYILVNLDDILKADVQELQEQIFHFETNFPESIGSQSWKKEDWTELYKVLREDIFEKEYDNWGGRTIYGAYYFVKELDVKTCPYCNRNYTFIVDEKDGKLRPEIDHFYPKSIYPFLAMSFHNLIPSCPICNHTKKDKDSFNLKLMNPYELEENTFKFTYMPKNANFSNLESQKYNFDDFDIKFKTSIRANDEVFKLTKLYEQHKDIVLDLLIKKVYYPKSYIDELKNSFGLSQDEIYRYLLCNYQKNEDLHKRPLSKLIKDISEELDLI